MAEITDVPNGGTQKEQRDLIFAIVSAAWVMTIIALKQDWLTLAEAQSFGVTFQNWWICAGITQGIYTYGESQRKKAFATLNR